MWEKAAPLPPPYLPRVNQGLRQKRKSTLKLHHPESFDRDCHFARIFVFFFRGVFVNRVDHILFSRCLLGVKLLKTIGKKIKNNKKIK